jgi:selenocysteine-specific elongation factor
MGNQLNYIIGTAGHIDHGKSTLIEALTGTDPDRLPEEKARGMTIDLGFGHLELPCPDASGATLSLGIIDVPGHADFVKNMVAGVGSIDVAMFVVAADDGWMPQSEEHLQILSYLGVQTAVIALTKSDTVEDIEFSAASVAESLEGSRFEGAPIIPVCAIIGDGLDELRATLAEVISKTSPPGDKDKARLSVDRVFSPQGVGTVVTGTMTGGRLKKGQKITIQPQGVTAKLRGIQSHQNDTDHALPGMRTALNLPEIGIRKGKVRDGIRRGDVITAIEQTSSSRRVHVLLERSERPSGAGAIQHAQRVRFHHGSANIAARILFFENRELKDGQQAIAEIRLDTPGFTLAGDRFVLRDWSKRFTLSGGTILDPSPAPRSYRTEAQGEFLSALAHSPPSAELYIDSLLHRDRAIPAGEVLTQSCFSTAEIKQALENCRHIVLESWLLDTAWWEDVCGIAAARIETIHEKHPELPGLDLNTLRAFMKKRLPDPKLFDVLINGLTQSGFIRAGNLIRSTKHAPQLPGHLRAAEEKICKALDANPLEPPGPKELAGTDDEMTALKFLVETGKAIQLDEKAILLDVHYQTAIKKIKAHITENGPSTAADIRQALGTTRRILIPLLERLDREAVTVRQGDLRTLKE